jgi:hypothetical protein
MWLAKKKVALWDQYNTVAEWIDQPQLVLSSVNFVPLPLVRHFAIYWNQRNENNPKLSKSFRNPTHHLWSASQTTFEQKSLSQQNVWFSEQVKAQGKGSC